MAMICMCNRCSVFAPNAVPSPAGSKNAKARPASVNDPAIRTNQIGFAPKQFKQAVVVIDKASAPKAFEIINARDEVVFKGDLDMPRFDVDSRETLSRGVFTSLTTPGTYRVRIVDQGISRAFVISASANHQALRLAARWFYLQRSGIAKDDGESGLKLNADRTRPAKLWDASGIHPDEKIDVTGGWWDAGDYGRYVPAAVSTLMFLFYAYRFNPSIFKDGFLGIPESGNGVSDLLDEARYELEWLRKMQRKDGAVHHKATEAVYSYELPDKVEEPTYLFDISSQATAQFAGVMAEASVVFQTRDTAFSKTLLNAAMRAWEWLLANPHKVPEKGFANPLLPNGRSSDGGPYSVHERPETEFRLFAAAALLKATNDRAFGDAFKTLWSERDQSRRLFGMSATDGYAFAAFAYVAADACDPELRREIRALLASQSEDIASVAESTGYTVALRGEDMPYGYVWGSNEYTLSRAVFLLLVNEFSWNPRWVDIAAAQLNWILGTNPLDQCYMTGIGAYPIKSLHHVVSMHLASAVPGAVGEGPNASPDDPVLEMMAAKNVPYAKRFADDPKSYASNEPTIYGNAAFVAVAAWFSR